MCAELQELLLHYGSYWHTYKIEPSVYVHTPIPTVIQAYTTINPALTPSQNTLDTALHLDSIQSYTYNSNTYGCYQLILRTSYNKRKSKWIPHSGSKQTGSVLVYFPSWEHNIMTTMAKTIHTSLINTVHCSYYLNIVKILYTT